MTPSYEEIELFSKEIPYLVTEQETRNADFRIERLFKINGKEVKYEIQSIGHNKPITIGVVLPKKLRRVKHIADGFVYDRTVAEEQKEKINLALEIAKDCLDYGFKGAAIGMPKKENSCIAYVCIPTKDVDNEEEMVRIVKNALKDENNSIHLSMNYKPYWSESSYVYYQVNIRRDTDHIKWDAFLGGEEFDCIGEYVEKLLSSVGVRIQPETLVSVDEAYTTHVARRTGEIFDTGIHYIGKIMSTPIAFPIKRIASKHKEKEEEKLRH